MLRLTGEQIIDMHSDSTGEIENSAVKTGSREYTTLNYEDVKSMSDALLDENREAYSVLANI